MPTARKLKSGSWNCKVLDHYETITDEDGKKTRKAIYKSFTCQDPTKKGKRTCEMMAAAWAAEKDHAKRIVKSDLTFGEYLDKYIADREVALSPRTISEYRRIRKKHMQGIMDIKLHQLTQDDIQDVINLEAKTHSPKTIKNWHGIISAVLGEFRPDMQLRTVIPKPVRNEIYIPSEAEIRKLLEYIKGTPLELPVLLAAFGPMRRGEIAALRKENIRGNVVHVCEAMVIQEDRTWTTKSPKTFDSDRYIDYPDYVASLWAEIPSGRICQLNPDQITHYFAKALKAAGVHPFRFHDLRHYSASMLHAWGIPDQYIMQRGGWRSDGTLINVYRHTENETQSQMTRIANDHFSALVETKVETE